MKNKTFYLMVAAAMLGACSGSEPKPQAGIQPETEMPVKGDATGSAVSPIKDPATQEPPQSKGVGKFQNVELTTPLNQAWVTQGQSVYDMKCAACHKLTDVRLVGPGWKDVTKRRTGEWIMNFTTNVDEMLTKDAEAQAMLEICMVRMPNQNVSDEDARALFEFMRHNDGVK